MTVLQFEEVASDVELSEQNSGKTVKCAWCGEIIRMVGNQLALAMCRQCYDRMLAEFLEQQMNHDTTHASDSHYTFSFSRR